MEFICVFSVGGSLASYLVKKESETTYRATLRNSQGRENNLPDIVLLERNGEGWKTNQSQPDVVHNLTQAIENNR